MMTLSALILAAGESKRYKKNKLFELYNGKPLIMWTIDLVRSIDFCKKIIVLNPKGFEVFCQLNMNSNGFSIMINEGYKEGIASSIRVGISEVMNTDGTVIFLADMPKIKRETVIKLMEHAMYSKKYLIVPVYNGKRGNPVLLKKHIYDHALSLKGDIGMRRFIKEYPHLVEFVDVNDSAVIFDIDFPPIV